jgi:hypothetical protein
MIHLEAPVFSLTKELVVFTVFIVVVIAAVIAIDIRPAREVVNETLPEMELPPELPPDEVPEVRLVLVQPTNYEAFFNEIEEFRNDFDGDR